MEIKYVLWTGGWDSTYLMLKLAQQKTTIQPIYCIDSCRNSTEFEIKAMNTMLPLIQNHKLTQAEILPIKTIKIEDLPEDKQISDSYHKVCETIKLGSQYEWLAKLAKQYPHLYIGIEKPQNDFNGCYVAVQKYAVLKKNNDGSMVDKELSTPECYTLFGKIIFSIADITEVEMSKDIKKQKYQEIMKHIWFCHTPINGRPCGRCRPCQQKMECGMKWLLPHRAHKRYKQMKQMENNTETKITLYSKIKKILTNLTTKNSETVK